MPRREEFRPEELHSGKDWFDDEKALESTFKTAEDVIDPDSGEGAFIDSLDKKIATEKEVAEEEKRNKEKEDFLRAQEVKEMEERRKEVMESFSKPKISARPEKPTDKISIEAPPKSKLEEKGRKKGGITKKELRKHGVVPRTYSYRGKERLKTISDSKKQRTFRDRIANFLGLQKEETIEKYDSGDYLDDHRDAA